MFKNETHNHPTEIEPFGGAATCLGGCIRDPLSGRSYVYQAMRVTGAGDPRTPFSETLPGKLPQKKICQIAARGYSSYGNQIGLATGQVAEIYHPGYVAKRMEIGAVVAAAPRSQVFRGTPAPGDVILLIGGRTGRDGVGGATGSSKEHTDTALENSAEVQKGDAPTERKIQRLFRNPELTRKIKVCNDFGAGGVSVAIGEIAPSLEINLDAVPKKYDGLDGTELAISESQERMAVCVDPADIDFFIREADQENLECVQVANVTDTGRLVMTWRGKTIVNLSRAFLDTNGVQQSAKVHVQRHPWLEHPAPAVLSSIPLRLFPPTSPPSTSAPKKASARLFDGSVGAGTVLWPFGGKHQLTPPDAMVGQAAVVRRRHRHLHLHELGLRPLSVGIIPVPRRGLCRHRGGLQGGRRRCAPRRHPPHPAGIFPETRHRPRPLGPALRRAVRRLPRPARAAPRRHRRQGLDVRLVQRPRRAAHAGRLRPRPRHGQPRALSPEFKQPGSTVSLVEVPRDADNLPDFDGLKQIAAQLHQLNTEGKLLALHHIGRAGLAAALAKMAFGNRIGFAGVADVQSATIRSITERYFAFLIEHTRADSSAGPPTARTIGHTTAEPALVLNGETHSLTDLQAAWTATLEPVYPTKPEIVVGPLEIEICGITAASKNPHPQSAIRNPQSTIRHSRRS